jgi:hypothetical protein
MFFERFISILRDIQIDCYRVLHTLENLRYEVALLKAGFNPAQPRVPAGNAEGGEWTGGSGGGGRDSPRPEGRPDNEPGAGSGGHISLPRRKPAHLPVSARLRQPPDYPTGRRASAIYGETSGLTPQLKNPKGSSYNPENWREDSAKKLATARAYIGIVSERNPRVHFSLPPDSANSIEARVWNDSVDAAIVGKNSDHLDRRVTNFFLRQEGIGRQKPENWSKTLNVLVTVGPFNNAGGGDVPRGPNTYIDFYGKDE